jgi:hypothetical protein
MPAPELTNVEVLVLMCLDQGGDLIVKDGSLMVETPRGPAPIKVDTLDRLESLGWVTVGERVTLTGHGRYWLGRIQKDLTALRKRRERTSGLSDWRFGAK